MSGFTKLFSSITESSIWCEDDKVLRVWVAMLARANAQGVVEGSVPGFASLCRMPISDMERCLATLEAPDPYSRTPDNEGRRIAPCNGGWVILNYLQYREKRQSASGSRASYMRNYREQKNKPKPVTCNSVTPENVTRNTEAEAEAEAEAEEKRETPKAPKGAARPRFTPPTREELDLAAAKLALPPSEVDKFVSYYGSKGWVVGRSPMKSWQHALTNWSIRFREGAPWSVPNAQRPAANPNAKPVDLSDDDANRMRQAMEE